MQHKKKSLFETKYNLSFHIHHINNEIILICEFESKELKFETKRQFSSCGGNKYYKWPILDPMLSNMKIFIWLEVLGIQNDYRPAIYKSQDLVKEQVWKCRCLYW